VYAWAGVFGRWYFVFSCGDCRLCSCVFFQGNRKNKYVTYLSVLAKDFILDGGIFIFVSWAERTTLCTLLRRLGTLLSVV